MAITLTYGALVLDLPADLLWVDEFRWSPVSQSAGRSITGEMLIDVSPRIGGRSITLQGEEDSAWILRSGLATLQSWAGLPEQEFTLTLMENDGGTLAQIEASLERIEEGTYGYCEETGEPIGLRRLEARPIATLSIEAQERHEKMEKVHRDD